MTRLEISIREDHRRLLLTATGPINNRSFTDFQEKLSRAVARGDAAVDMELVTALSSAGIGAIIAAMEEAETAGHGFAIVNPSEAVRQALDSTGFGDRFPILISRQ
jgi:Anti-anti-sigma regulatory factor (antagonist of anti-sigma factor)